MKVLFTNIFLFLFTITFAQIYNCVSADVNKELFNTSVDFRQKQNQFESLWQEVQDNPALSRQIFENGSTIYEIPIVIHVFHTGNAVGEQYNPSDQELIDWIDRANQVFSAEAADIDDSNNGGTSIPIRFVLAKRTESCEPTNGIIRLNGSTIFGARYTNYGIKRYGASGVLQSELHDASRWNSLGYYNIYIVNKVDANNGLNGGIQGWAYLAGAGTQYDGSVMLSNIVKPDDIIFPHEMGHAFGLYHVFEGGNQQTCPPNDNCLVDNDKICDTEPSKMLLGLCIGENENNSCTGQLYQGVQYNIMNYGNCLTRFTVGQKERMLLSMHQFRYTLMNSKGGLPPNPNENPISLTPAVCNPSPNSDLENNFNIGPWYVGLKDIDFNSQGFSYESRLYYIDRTLNNCVFQNTSTELYTGHTYELHLGTGPNPNNGKAFIDFNNDGSFDPINEKIFEGFINEDFTILSQEFTIPNDAIKDVPLRLRIMVDFNPLEGPCDTLQYGQTEDYAVIIKDKLTSPIVEFDKGIGINTLTPQAELDIYSESSGVLFPRLTINQISQITNPVEGMIIYNLDDHCLMIYNSLNSWKCIKTKKVNF